METEPTTGVSVAVLRADLANLLDAAQWRDAKVQITRHNKPAAYLVSPEWFERARVALGET